MTWLRNLTAGKTVFRVLRVCALALVFAALANPAFAGGPHGNNGHHGKGGGGSGGDVPEVDPNSLTGALALLGGGMLVLTDRFRKK